MLAPRKRSLKLKHQSFPDAHLIEAYCSDLRSCEILYPFLMSITCIQMNNLSRWYIFKYLSGYLVHPSKFPWTSLIAQLLKNPPAMQRPWFSSWVGKTCWRRDRLPTPIFLGFPCGLAGNESTCSAGNLGLIPGLGRSPGEEKCYPLQYSGLENSMDCIVHGITKSWTQLSNFHFPICSHLQVSS